MEKYTLRFETRLVPKETDPIEWTPELEVAYTRKLEAAMRQSIDAMYERLLYGRPVSDVTVVDGQIVTRPELPEGGR